MTDTQFDGYKKLLALAQANPGSKNKMRQAMVAAGVSFENEGEPWSGYYRMAEEKGGPLLPIAIWRQDDQLFIYWGGNEARPEKVWPSCGMSPIPYAWFEAKAERGEEWPDLPPEGWREDEDESPPVSHNMPPEQTEAEAAAQPKEPTELEKAQAEFEKLKAIAKQFATIRDDLARDQSQVTRTDATALAGKLDRQREALVRPHIDAQRDINGAWNPIIKDLKALAETIRASQNKWADIKLQKRLEDEKLALEQQQKADEQRAAEYEQAAEEGREPTPPPHEATMPVAPPAAPVTTSFRGGRGRSSRELAVDELFITDQDAVYKHFRENEQLKALLLKLATAIFTDTGQLVPGTDSKKVGKVA